MSKASEDARDSADLEAKRTKLDIRALGELSARRIAWLLRGPIPEERPEFIGESAEANIRRGLDCNYYWPPTPR
jgi:hypothetical protein